MIKYKDKNMNDNKNKEKCYHCNKKLKMINFTCRCNHKFCKFIKILIVIIVHLIIKKYVRKN